MCFDIVLPPLAIAPLARGRGTKRWFCVFARPVFCRPQRCIFGQKKHQLGLSLAKKVAGSLVAGGAKQASLYSQAACRRHFPAPRGAA